MGDRIGFYYPDLNFPILALNGSNESQARLGNRGEWPFQRRKLGL